MGDMKAGSMAVEWAIVSEWLMVEQWASRMEPTMAYSVVELLAGMKVEKMG